MVITVVDRLARELLIKVVVSMADDMAKTGKWLETTANSSPRQSIVSACS